MATHKALQNLLNKRPFVLMCSTFMGSGSYVAHQMGDKKATWEDLRYSISTILNFGIFRMPMVGADICGLYPNTTEELCRRWIQLGAFYPFSRDHSNLASKHQELYLWDSIAKLARKYLGLRYRLLPYLYTWNYDAHTTGASISRPLFFSFPLDRETYAMSKQFLLGRGILISPVLYNKTISMNDYFPKGSWYNLKDMTIVVKYSGQYVTLQAPIDTINVHVCKGIILPMKIGGMTIIVARMTPFTLIIVFPLRFQSTSRKAKEHLFLDSGENVEMKIAEGKSTYIDFSAESDGKKVRLVPQV